MATKTTSKVQPPAIATQALDLLEKGLNRNADAIAQISKTVADVLPELPTLPFVNRIPSAETVVKTTFAVADRLLAIQKAYALKVVEAFAPVRAKVTTPETNGATA